MHGCLAEAVGTKGVGARARGGREQSPSAVDRRATDV